MRYAHQEPDKSRPQDYRAAIFVDYENLFGYLYHRVGSRSRPDDFIGEILDELRRYLLEEVRTQTAMISAYADFSEMHGNGQYIQRALYLRGIESRFVPSTLQRNAAEIQLCVDAIEAMHNRPDVRTFVIVTGDRPYLPLVQQFKRYGCQALIVTLAPPPSTESLPYIEDDVFLNAANLLSDSSRHTLTSSSSATRSSVTSATAPTPTQPSTRPQPVDYHSVTDEGAHYALEIIEEHFGQYEEVYLTPLLRKLSELLDENQYDPKTLISELEEAGAVWLEKRRGFPYDYTVLLIDSEHPDVAAIQKDLYDREQSGEFVREYDDQDDQDDIDDLDDSDDFYAEDDYDDYDDDDLDDLDDVDDIDNVIADEPYSNGSASTSDEDLLDNYAEEDELDNEK